jgi:hypothetical protein
MERFLNMCFFKKFMVERKYCDVQRGCTMRQQLIAVTTDYDIHCKMFGTERSQEMFPRECTYREKQRELKEANAKARLTKTPNPDYQIDHLIEEIADRKELKRA